MRKPIIAGNWKMNTTVEEAISLVEQMKDELESIEGVDTVLCPPFVSLIALRQLLEGSPIALGAQNMYFEDKGAYTGEISPAMLSPLCEYVIIGHSERRHYFGETDETVNRKMLAAFQHKLKPIFCVGENLEENEAGVTAQVVRRQVLGGLKGIEAIDNIVVAYEPVWAIGTGRPATGEGAEQVIRLIRRTLVELYGADAAERTRIQYGGSVSADNIAEFVSQPGIDGALVGGASLKPAQFAAIVRQAAEIKSKKRAGITLRGRGEREVTRG